MLIVSAFEMTGSAGARWLIGLVGVLAIIVGIILFAHPVAGIWTIILVIGIYAIVAGIILMITSIPVRSRQKKEAAAA
jgi:uncharacterized membrane protein HdeD (DUF308 family)